MNNANVFDQEEKISKTALATKLAETGSEVIQVCFTTKPNEKVAAEVLSQLKAAPKNVAQAKDLIEQCLQGRERTITCYLVKSENNLGRSSIIELATGGFKQVDHRSIKWLIVNNVKYTLK